MRINFISTALIPLLCSLCMSCIEVTTSKGEDYLSANGSSSSVVTPSGNGDVIEQEYLSKQDLDRRQNKLAEAESDYNADPDNEENIIWYGRRMAYVGRLQEAVNIFSEGLAKFPTSYKLFRHRGHQLLTLREFDQGIEDLHNAAFYALDVPANEIEPDITPNTLNKPLSNVQWNIYYHLGLAYFMKGNYDKSISSFKKCMDFSNNNDLDIKTTNWLYVTYRKIGNTDVADALISIIPSRMRIIETRVYHDLIMLYRGFVTPEFLIRRNTSNNILNADVGYGIGNWYLLEGHVESALNVFNRVLEGSQRDAFGYIATEVEMNTLANTANL